jgi:uncharacterized damage-inducible protein DinB
MSLVVNLMRTHLDYTAWASRRLVEAASQLTPDELNHDFKTANHSVLGTLVHVYAADRIWLKRLQGVPQAPFVTDADHHLAVLQNDWPELYERWKKFLAGVTEEKAQAAFAYTDMKGKPWNQPLWQLVLHVVNHGTHHRGQVSGFLRALGHVPPVNDLVAYYREVVQPK